MSSKQEIFLPLAFDSSYLTCTASFPINLAFWKKESSRNKLLCKATSVETLKCCYQSWWDKEAFLFLLSRALFTKSHHWELDHTPYKYPLTILKKENSSVAMCRILSWGLFSIAIKGVLFVSSHFLQWFKDQSCFTAVLPLKVFLYVLNQFITVWSFEYLQSLPRYFFYLKNITL